MYDSNFRKAEAEFSIHTWSAKDNTHTSIKLFSKEIRIVNFGNECVLNIDGNEYPIVDYDIKDYENNTVKYILIKKDNRLLKYCNEIV